VKLETQIEYKGSGIIFDSHTNPAESGAAGGLEVGMRKLIPRMREKRCNRCFPLQNPIKNVREAYFWAKMRIFVYALLAYFCRIDKISKISINRKHKFLNRID